MNPASHLSLASPPRSFLLPPCHAPSTARCVPGEGKCVPLSCTGRVEMPPKGTTNFSDFGVVLKAANNGTFPTTVDRLVELLRDAYAKPNQSGLPPCFRESPARGASTAGDRLCFRFRRPVKFFGVDFHVCYLPYLSIFFFLAIPLRLRLLVRVGTARREDI